MLYLEIVTRHNSLPWGFTFIHYPWKLILRSKWGILCAWFSLDYTHFFMKDDSITPYDTYSPEQIKAAHYFEFLSPWISGVYFMLFKGMVIKIMSLGTGRYGVQMKTSAVSLEASLEDSVFLPENGGISSYFRGLLQELNAIISVNTELSIHLAHNDNHSMSSWQYFTCVTYLCLYLCY